MQSLKNNNNYHQNIEKTLTNIQEAANYAIDEIDTWQGILGLHDVVTDGNLADAPRLRLAEAVKAVVWAEGPVHVDEVVRRIRTLWGLKRSGKKIQEAVTRGIEYAVSQKEVDQRDNFLWKRGQTTAQARCRDAREMLKIELICDREIEDAVFSTLRIQFASPQEAIPTTAARLLGFQQTSEQIRKRIDNVVRRMLKDGRLAEIGNGMIDVQERDRERIGTERK